MQRSSEQSQFDGARCCFLAIIMKPLASTELGSGWLVGNVVMKNRCHNHSCYSLPLRLFISAVESPWLFLSFISNQLQRQKWSCLQHRRGSRRLFGPLVGTCGFEKSMGFNTARLASLNSAGKLKWSGSKPEKDLRSATEIVEPFSYMKDPAPKY